MRSHLWILAIYILLASCKNEKDTKSLNPDEPEVTNEVVALEKIECFSYIGERDTIFMSIHIKNDSIVEGELTYSLYEKDKNKGTLRGILKGDSLFADYEFSSKGKTSTREIFFLKTEKEVIEGYATVKKSGNKSVFSNKNFTLKKNMPLNRVDCL